MSSNQPKTKIMLSKNKNEKSEGKERKLDLNLENDRRIVRDFEKELEPYEARSLMVMSGTPYARELSGLWLYLHTNGIYRYNERYPLGAVVDPVAFGVATAKHAALTRLRDRREWTKNNTA